MFFKVFKIVFYVNVSMLIMYFLFLILLGIVAACMGVSGTFLLKMLGI